MVPVERVVIRHPKTRGVAIVAASAVAAHGKRGWVVLDENAPKPVVLEAAEALGVAVDPDATRSQIMSELKPDEHTDELEG